MIPQINILSVVDVIGALSTGTLQRSLYIVDNHPANCVPLPADAPPHGHTHRGHAHRPPRDQRSQRVRSSNLATRRLVTHVTFGQVLNWHATGIDFQTDVQIKNIVFSRHDQVITAEDTPCAKLGLYGAPSGEYWAGLVNLGIEPGDYQYKIEFSVNGKSMLMEDFAVLKVSS